MKPIHNIGKPALLLIQASLESVVSVQVDRWEPRTYQCSVLLFPKEIKTET